MMVKSRGACWDELVAGNRSSIMRRRTVPKRWTALLCIASFCLGLLFTNRVWTMPEEPKLIIRRSALQVEKMSLVSADCKQTSINEGKEQVVGEVPKAQTAAQIQFVLLGCPKDHVEGYLELSAKTKSYFVAAVSLWDADLYVKVDDDVHVNIATLWNILGRHRSKQHVYIGCMKTGAVLAQMGVKYHEPEYWKFGEWGNKYFRHAAGQLYAISKDLASYISLNQHVLHKYANEDVSIGAWFIGLDVQHIDDRRLCCATPPDCEGKAKAGNVCAASFDWSCNGICKLISQESVHQRCGEGDDALWTANF